MFVQKCVYIKKRYFITLFLPILQIALQSNGRSNGMIKIHLSKMLGERRMTQAELSRRTGIRANTIGELYHELAERVNLDHLDRICKVLNCELGELIEWVPDSDTQNDAS